MSALSGNYVHHGCLGETKPLRKTTTKQNK